jgi:asparagine synthase (glutamine-hydrolysing)
VYLTDGCVDVSHAADLYVNERAAQIAPVRMTGNYGGEVLRRVRAFKPVQPANGLFAPELLAELRNAETTYEELLEAHPLSFAVFKQAPWHHYGLLSLEQTQVALRSPFLDNDFVRTVFRAPQAACTNDTVSRRLIADGNTALTHIRTDRGPISGLNGWRAGAIRKLIDFTIKAEYAYDYGMPQWVARVDHAFAALRLERLFLGRNKFYHYRVWYRDALSEYVRSMLLDSRTLSRPYLQPAKVKEIVAGHVKGDHNYTSQIHKLLSLELISRTLIECQ